METYGTALYFQVADNRPLVLASFDFKIYPKMKSEYEDYYSFLKSMILKRIKMFS